MSPARFAICLDSQELGRVPVGPVGRDHARVPTRGVTRPGNEARIASTISAAASSGRLKLAGSASGIASACSGVFMSPGSIDRKSTPSAFASSAQIAVR
jgi:hypothetical protein